MTDRGRSAVVACPGCHRQRWAGLGPCQHCGTPSPEWDAETERINAARAEAGLPPLNEETTNA